MDLELDGRVVLVTGGSDGLGAALADRLVREGARVAICARDPGRLEAAAAQIDRGPGEVLAVPADVTVDAEVEAFVDAALRRWGRIDALVNNAGTGGAKPFSDITDDDWDADLQLKLFAAVRTCRLALPSLVAASGGSILNVLSFAAKAPPARSMPTSVSRAAGLALTKTLSRELAADGVRVNAVLVGLIASGQWVRKAAAEGTTVDDYHAGLAARWEIPLGRVGRAEEFADLAAFLVSPRASYVTGAAVPCDGGVCPVT